MAERETGVADGAADPLADGLADVRLRREGWPQLGPSVPVMSWASDVDRLLAALAVQRAARERAEAAIARARALHAPQKRKDSDRSFCTHCLRATWPCPTVAALETETP